MTFSSFVVSKWEVRLRTSFFSVFGVEKQPQGIGWMLLKHRKHICFFWFSLFQRMCVLSLLGVTFRGLLGCFWVTLGAFSVFVVVQETDGKTSDF